MTLQVLSKKNRMGEVVIKTGLSVGAIVEYTRRICDALCWTYNIANISRAKEVLNAMVIIESQYKLFLPVDFDEILEKTINATKLN